MTNRLWATAVERAGALALDALPDADLLRRFLADREEAAFAAIVRRHGPLVWGLCRQVLPTEADAEDAFQATFLALVRGAGRISRPNALGAWLHRVAGRVCRNGLRALARRRKHERSAAVIETVCPVDEATWNRWQSSVHDEIDRLPESLRVPFVLCVLQGVRQPEAARQLGWKLGTVSGRVCKAKQALTAALIRRELAGSAVLAGLVGLSRPISAGLAGKATILVRSGTPPGGLISVTVHELARGATGGFMWKTKLMAVALLTATLSIGIGTRALSTADAQGFDPRTGPPAGGADPAPKTSPRPAAPTPGTGMNMPGMGGMPGMSGMAASAGRNPRVEYRFLARPESADAFKKLLTQQGTDGWEYAGSVPGDGELIFKRTQALSGGFFGGGMMPGGGAADMTPFGGGFGSRSGGGAGGFGVPSSPGGPLTPGANDGGKTTGGLPARFGGSTLPANPTLPSATSTDSGVTSKMSLRVGETIRHLMKSKQAVDRVHSDNTRSVEVSLDPTDAKRVLIRGLNTDGARIELTDANGNKERYIVEVR